MQHPNDLLYFEHLQRVGFEAAKQYGIHCKIIEAKKRPQTGDGLAYVTEDRISVSVRNKQTKDFGGQWSVQRYKHEYNLHTLAHELAHLAAYQLENKYIGHADQFRKHDVLLRQLVVRLDREINHVASASEVS